MNVLQFPWLEFAIGIAVVGSAGIAWDRDPARAYRWGLAFTCLSFAGALLAWLAYYLGAPAESLQEQGVQSRLFGREIFRLDHMSAPLIPLVALLHFLTAVATPRRSIRRFSLSWSLAAEALRLATFSCQESWTLVGLLAAATVPPYIELVNRQRPVRVYVLHMALFVTLMIAGWAAVDMARDFSSVRAQIGSVLLMAAILVRCGTIPVHCWVTHWFEHASLGIGILYIVPLSGVYAAVRLVLPIAPEWVLRSIGLMSLATAVYAAGMATVQRDARRFYAFLFLSHASLVLVGLELRTVLSLTASLCLWLSVILSLGGFGLVLRALEARFGRLDLIEYHGLYGHSPALAVCFLLTGLASVGFPATIGFVATELMVDSAIEASPLVGIGVVAAAALNGIAVVRANLLLFTGTRHFSTVSLEIGPRERLAVLTLVTLIVGGGLFPQAGVTSRFQAVERLLGNAPHAPEQRLSGELGGATASERPAEAPVRFAANIETSEE